MKTTVKINGQQKQVTTKHGMIREILQKINLPLEAYILKKNGEIITEDEKLKNNDEIELIKVVSGG